MRNNTPRDLIDVVEDERLQRAMTFLRDVAYVIEAHFDLTSRAGADDSEGKHLDIFTRRARQGQCFHTPCLGVREFPASFQLLEKTEDIPVTSMSGDEASRELGWMLHDIDFAHGSTPRFFRAVLKNGVVEVPAWNSEEVKS